MLRFIAASIVIVAVLVSSYVVGIARSADVRSESCAAYVSHFGAHAYDAAQYWNVVHHEASCFVD